jgi:hypothetical protein
VRPVEDVRGTSYGECSTEQEPWGMKNVPPIDYAAIYRGSVMGHSLRLGCTGMNDVPGLGYWGISNE